MALHVTKYKRWPLNTGLVLETCEAQQKEKKQSASRVFTFHQTALRHLAFIGLEIVSQYVKETWIKYTPKLKLYINKGRGKIQDCTLTKWVSHVLIPKSGNLCRCRTLKHWVIHTHFQVCITYSLSLPVCSWRWRLPGKPQCLPR